MIGAIMGDTVGSVYEFNNTRIKDFDLMSDSVRPTDDTIMTLAVAEICQKRLYDNKENVIDTLKKWGRAYPNAGYGGRFRKWLFTDSRDAYGSYGNGSAMRISPVGWYGRNEEEVRYIARKVTEVTHNHEEGLKGAEVVAMCIYYARIGKSKEFIKDYVEQYYNLDFNYDELKEKYYFNETCQESVPQAIYCFLISNSFEDCLRTTISIGGDCDTTSAISCAIAEAYYKEMDNELVKDVLSRLPNKTEECNPKQIVLEFYKYQDIISVYDCEIIEENKNVVAIEKLYHDAQKIEFIYARTLYTLSRYLLNYLIGDNDVLYEKWKFKENIVEDNKDALKIAIALDTSENNSKIGYIGQLCSLISCHNRVNCALLFKSEAINYLRENYNVDHLILSSQYTKML